MAYTNLWDITRPAGSVLANTIDTEIQAVRVDVQDRIGDIFGIATFNVDPIVPTLVKLNRTANSKILGGTVSLSWRNAGDSADNLIITDAGLATFRNIVTAPGFSGNVTGSVTGNVTGNLTGTILTAAQANITSLGTLTALTVSGVTNTASLVITGLGYVQFRGTTNATGAIRNVSGTLVEIVVADGTGLANLQANVITAAGFSGNITGTILTASQTNISAVGLLTNLTVDGTSTPLTTSISTRSLRLTTAVAKAQVQFGTDNTGYTLNIAKNNAGAITQLWDFQDNGDFYPSVDTAGNIGTGAKRVNTVTAVSFIGALTGNVTGNVTGNLTGTILTAAQGNITSLGILTSLTVTGAVIHGSSRVYNGGATAVGVGSATTIYTLNNAKLAYLVVAGDNGAGKTFIDVIAVDGVNGFVAPVTSNVLVGVPSARAYSITGLNVQLTMSAAGTTVRIFPLEFL